MRNAAPSSSPHAASIPPPSPPAGGGGLAGATPSIPNAACSKTFSASASVCPTVDTFGPLRDEAQERDEHMKNAAFISCLERWQVDRVAA